MSFTLTNRGGLQKIHDRLMKYQMRFEKYLSDHGLNTDSLEMAKTNLSILLQSDDWVLFSEVMANLIFYCDSGIIQIDSSKYNEGNRFLCREFKDLLEGGIFAMRNNLGSDLDTTLQVTLLSHINDTITIEGYTSDICNRDIEFLYSLFQEVNRLDGYNENVLDDIKNCYSQSDSLKCAVGCMANLEYMMECLRELYGNTFSLYPYVGVLTFFGDAARRRRRGDGSEETRVVSMDAKVRPDTDATFFKPNARTSYDTVEVYKELATNISKISSEYRRGSQYIDHERCFNLDSILDSDDGLYYPYEALGFATGSEFMDYYNPSEGDIAYKSAGCSSWGEYEGIIKPKLRDLLALYIYKSLERHCKTASGESFRFTDRHFLEDYADLGKEVCYVDYCSVRYKDAVLRDVDKFVKTVCRAAIITRNDDNELYKIKVMCFDGRIKADATREIFNSAVFLNGSKNVRFSDAYTRRLDNIGGVVLEFTFCLDIRLMDKKPLFGYTAARQFRKQGIVVNQRNIIIGETEDSTPLFSTPGGVIDLNTMVVHRFSAGSRSGKGVMTMNILASLIASDAALFYIDRKPDMAAELGYLSGGDMFVVNGGDIQTTDVHHMFTKDKLLEGFCPGSSKYNRKYLRAVFGNDFGATWEGALGDFVYARAMILSLGIIAARMYFTGNECPDVAMEELFINGSVAVVIDEITNWHNQFEHKYFETLASSGNISSSAIARFYRPLVGGSVKDDASDLDSIMGQVDEVDKELLSKYQQEIEAYREASASGDEKATSKLKTANNNLRSLITKLQKKASQSEKDIEEILYWTTYCEKYKSMIDVVSAIKNAGIKQSMMDNNNVYLIGQFISGVANTGDPITFNKDGSVRQQGTPESFLKLASTITPNASNIASETLTRSYLLGFAEALGCDWFTGRNLTDKNDPNSLRHANFGGTCRADVGLDQWLHERGNWIYIPQGTQEMFRGGTPDQIPKSYVKFKPYLVLNTNDEPERGVKLNDTGLESGSTTSPYNADSLKYYDNTSAGYVLNCAKRVGFSDWEKLRLSHVKKSFCASRSNPCYGHLEEGVGLRGLIEEYKRTDPEYSAYEFHSDCLKRSKEIADAVVRHFGYTDYMEYLLDFSPKGLIGASDIIEVYKNPDLTMDEEARHRMQLPRYYNSGYSSLISGGALREAAPDSDLGVELLQRESVEGGGSDSRRNAFGYNDSVGSDRAGDEFDRFDVVSDEGNRMTDEELAVVGHYILDACDLKFRNEEPVIQLIISFLRRKGW